MAERRMFAKTIIDSDAFIDMPMTARLLYYDLAMRADDDGFVNSPKKIVRMIGASEDDLKVLAAKKFIIPFENGVVVIKHWRIHNYIRKDTYKETTYKDEKALLQTDENNAYRLTNTGNLLTVNEPSTNRGRNVDEPWTQDRLGKDRLGKDRLGKDRLGDCKGERDSEESLPTPKKPPKQKYGEYNHVKLTEEEFNRLCNDFGESTTLKAIKAVDEYCQQNGKTYKDYNLAIRRWGIRAANEEKTKDRKNLDDVFKEWEEKFGGDGNDKRII